jgi:hypothetical protein
VLVQREALAFGIDGTERNGRAMLETKKGFRKLKARKPLPEVRRTLATSAPALRYAECETLVKDHLRCPGGTRLRDSQIFLDPRAVAPRR